MTSWLKHKHLIWVVLIALILRLLLGLVAIQHPERAYTPDSASYIDFANAIINGQGWEYPFAIRTPMYPLFLAGLLALFGETAFLIVFVQILISVGNVILTFWLAKQFFDKKFAVLSALLLALSMESITHAFYLLTETLFTLLFLLTTIFLLRTKQTVDWKFAMLSGFFLGLSILTRPLNLYYPLVGLVILFWGQPFAKKQILIASSFLFSCCIVVAPWVARNAIVINMPVVSTISTQNLLYYNAAALQTQITGKNEDIVRNEFSDQVRQIILEHQLPNNAVNRSYVERELAHKIIFSDLTRYVFIHLKSDLNSFLPDTDLLEIFGINAGQKGTLNILKQKGLLLAIQHYFGGNFWMVAILLPVIVLLGITYLGWSVGAFQLFQKQQFFTLVFFSLPILYSLLLPGPPSNPRFRVPIMPYIVIMASQGLYWLANFIKSRVISRSKTQLYQEK